MIQTRKHLYLLFFILFLIIEDVHSQRVFKGHLNDYNLKQAEIITGMRKPIIIGEINATGDFIIPLDDQFINEVKKSIDEENKNSDQWSTSLMTLERAFGCQEGTVKIKNGDQPVIKLSTFNSFTLADVDEEKILGFFMAVSSRPFAESQNNFEHGKAQVGYMIDWYYFAEPATVKGKCSVKTYTLTQKEEDAYQATTNYDLNIQPGWNLIKYSNDDIHTDSVGKNYVKDKSYTSIDEIPAEIEYIYFNE